MRPELELIAEKFKQDPVFFAEKLLNFKPTPYQEKLLRDSSKLISARWCRQSGKTTTFGIKILHFAITRPNVTVIVVAPSLRQSRNVRDKMEPLINAIPKPIRKLIFKKIQREAIWLRNGSVIKFYPNSPDLIRGETADMIYVDEAAMFRDDRYMFNHVLKHMLATTERKGHGYLYVSSTPKNMRSLFYEMCQPESGFSHHHVTWREAVEAGLISREWVEDMRRQLLPSEFRMELEAEFVEDLDSWLPYDLISSCIDPLLEPYSLEDGPRGEFYIGVDLGKHVDYSVVAVVMREGAKLKLVHLHRFPLKTPYANVIGYVKALCKNYHRVEAVYVDQTGVGEYIVEDMKESGIPAVKGIILTMHEKEELMTFLKQKMLNRQIAIPHINELIAELNIEKFEVTSEGRIRFNHSAGTHDDMLWAFALAIYATKDAAERLLIL